MLLSSGALESHGLLNSSPMKRRLLFLALGLAAVILAGAFLLRANIREVIPGEMYASAQLSGSALARVVRDKGIRTVINLRRAAPDEAWYRQEVAVANELGLVHHSVGLYGSSLHVDQVIEVYGLVRAAERPLLVHCRAGIDRTGLASVLGLLADGGYGLDEVRERAGRWLDRLRGENIGADFLAQYGAWLVEHRMQHSPDLLDRWLKTDYLDPTGNIHFLVHPIDGRAWYKPFGRYAEGERFTVERAGNAELVLDGWAFDARTGALLADVEARLDGRPVETTEYGIHSPWLIDDFGNAEILDSGWLARQPMDLLSDGCHVLSFRFNRQDGSQWVSPPAGRICIE
jgi:protein tyrosine phosphatase (PTP) superfamily phosphohydrolase (DUF442 family)